MPMTAVVAMLADAEMDFCLACVAASARAAVVAVAGTTLADAVQLL